MSTRSIIYLELKEEDLHTTKYASLNLFDQLGKKIIFNNSFSDFYGYAVTNPVMLPTFELNTQIVDISVTFDGYLDGVGKELFFKFNAYNKVLNLILLGDCESILGSHINPTYTPTDLEYPIESKGFNYINKHDWCPVMIDYAYLFKNNKWLVTKHPVFWTDLGTALKRKDK